MHKWNCGFCHGLKMLVFGVLILINEFLLKWSWGLFLGLIFLIFGFMGLKAHGKCTCEMENKMMVDIMKKAPRRKR